MSLGPEDVLAIQQVIASYCQAIDSGDGDAVAELFTDDASLGVGLPDPFVGKEVIREMGGGVSTMVPGVRHVTTNVVIDGDGDTASARSYVQVFTTVGGPEQTRLVASGIYVDALRKDGGKWRFVSREMTNDG
jgi:uncharacterized protein (TIGR02246 family)